MSNSFLHFFFNARKHREEVSQAKTLRDMVFPAFTRKFLLRLFIVVVVAYGFFGYICIPERLGGESMEPTYRNKSFNFCWRPAYWFSKPERGDVVMVRMAGKNVMYLKRIVALEGETLEFRDGKLFIDGKEQKEPYVFYSCRWNLPPRKVKEGNYYFVGDNRSMPLELHDFGQTTKSRIMGAPLW